MCVGMDVRERVRRENFHPSKTFAPPLLAPSVRVLTQKSHVWKSWYEVVFFACLHTISVGGKVPYQKKPKKDDKELDEVSDIKV